MWRILTSVHILCTSILRSSGSAFDCVSHKVLLSKLKHYGITGTFYELYRPYLDGRYQRTSLSSAYNNNNKLLSKWVKISNGVAQWSVLGPFLFLICINDLPSNVEQIGFLILFVDDSSILISHSNLLEFIQKLNIVFKTWWLVWDKSVIIKYQ